MAPKHTVHLVDASPYVFRAYFSIPVSVTGPGGRPTNAVHGFATFLLRYVADEQPTHLGIAFDGSLTTSFRNEIYPAYKAQRELPPPELEEQLEACREVARALGAATYVDERYEADDLIGTLAAQLARRGHRVVVVSSDKDLAQLVSPALTLFDYAKGERYGARAVRAKFGVDPGQIVDYLALAGDSVDNIPGVAGVGCKTAVALLAAFGTLEGVYADLERVAELPLRGATGIARRLAEERESAFLSRELATIAQDAPVRARLSELRYRGADPALVDPLFGALRLWRIRDRISSWNEARGASARPGR